MSYWVSSVTMCDAGLEDFRRGLVHMRDGRYDEALGSVRSALRAVPTNPFYLSYAGLLTAVAEGRITDGVDLCHQALERRYNHPQLYLNLAEVYEHVGQKPEAIEVLEKGYVSAGRDFRIRRALERVGRRRPPVLSFLERENLINRALGRLRHRLFGAIKTS